MQGLAALALVHQVLECEEGGSAAGREFDAMTIGIAHDDQGALRGGVLDVAVREVNDSLPARVPGKLGQRQGGRGARILVAMSATMGKATVSRLD